MKGIVGADARASGRRGRHHCTAGKAPGVSTTEPGLSASDVLKIGHLERQATKERKSMKKLMIVRSKTAVAGLAFVLAAVAGSKAAVIHVPADYSTIQAAVDAAHSGDTIRIAAGTYRGQVLIARKNLRLVGEPGAVLEAVEGMAPTFAPYGDSNVRTLLGIALCDNVTVSGLTLDGRHLADANAPQMAGVIFHGSSGRVENCFFKGFRPRSGPGAPGGACAAGNFPYLGRPLQELQVLNNRFEDNHRSIGMTANSDPNDIRLRFRIQGNIITGVGPTDTGLQNGIEIYDGTTGEISNNTITDYFYTGGGLGFSLGIDATSAGMPVRYTHNFFQNNQVGLFTQYGQGSQFVNNTFEGPGYGIVTSDSGDQIVNNQFTGSTIGIGLLGLDPDFGTTLGIASDATLIANRFCNVAVPIRVEQLVEGTVEQANNLDACH
jgi:nitrous oxidase accessory protein NosD